MKRGFLKVIICMFTIALLSQAVFGLSSVGLEKNITKDSVSLASTQSNNCLVFETMSEQIQCRLTSTHLLPTQSIFCSETQRTEWCEKLLEEANSCVQYNGTRKDKCFVSKANSHISIEYTPTESYILLLILDLVNDAQTRFENGKLDFDSASTLISKLTNVAHTVMRHEPQAVISILFAEYAQEYEKTEP